MTAECYIKHAALKSQCDHEKVGYLSLILHIQREKMEKEGTERKLNTFHIFLHCNLSFRTTFLN